MDDQKYTDFIADAPKGSKPWIVMFAYTPFYMPSLNQPTDNMLRNLACIATLYKDSFNVGFMDYRASEKVIESYDVKLDYGKTTPALFIFDNGRAYPSKPSTLTAYKLHGFLKNYKDGECIYCPQETLAPQTELTMYIEYAKNEVARSMYFREGYKFVEKHLSLIAPYDTYVKEKYLVPIFGPQNGRKAIGEKFIFYVLGTIAWWLMTGSIAICYGIYVWRKWCKLKAKRKIANAEDEKWKEQ